MNSLKARAGLATMAVVALFAVLTAGALERAFHDSAEAARAERLNAQLFLLMGAVEISAAGEIRLPERLPEPRLEAPDSGLYARVISPLGQSSWVSPSALGRGLPGAQPGAGLRQVEWEGTEYFSTSLAVDWEVPTGTVPLIFQVVEDRSGFAEELARFRRSLWGWLATAAAGLLLVQAVALRWGLRPLRTVETELRAIERGERDAIEGRYPDELARLTDNLNTLLRHERAQQARYRDALGDLAHSLKTPLAVLRGSFEAGAGEHPDQAVEQLERMDRIVAYQLQRASTSGRSALAAPVAVRPLIERLLRSLDKVYRDKGIEASLRGEAAAAFRGSEDDLMELLGNLLDNAYKFASRQVRVSASVRDGELDLLIEDDGPGIPEAEVPTILSRGGRLDEAVPGQGIGLAVVGDIVRAYDGRLEIERSDWGGARLRCRLPAGGPS